MRRPAILVALAALAACGGPTEIVASVESDIAAARQPALSLAVTRLDGTALYTSCLPLDGVALPLTLGMTPASASVQRFRVTARGHTSLDCGDDPPLVEQSATVRFHEGKRELLSLGLYDACVGVRCDPGQTCDPATRQCVDDGREVLPPLDGTDLAAAPPPDLGTPDLAPADLGPPGPFVLWSAGTGARRPAVATNGSLYLLAFEELDASMQPFVRVGTVDLTGQFRSTGVAGPGSSAPEVVFGARLPTAPAFLSYTTPSGAGAPYLAHLVPLDAAFGVGTATGASVPAYQPEAALAATGAGEVYLAAYAQTGVVDVYHWTGAQLVSTNLTALLDTVALGCDTGCVVFGHSGTQLLSYGYSPATSLWARPPLVVADSTAAAELAVAPGALPTYVWSTTSLVWWQVGTGPSTAVGASVPSGERPTVTARPGGGTVMSWNGGGGVALLEQLLSANGQIVSSGPIPLVAPGEAHNPRVKARGPERLVVWDDGQGRIWGIFRP